MDSGVEWLRKAAEAEPANVAYRVMFARALTDSGRPDEALAVADRPTGTSPAELALWHARAEAAQALLDHASAAEAWQILSGARAADCHKSFLGRNCSGQGCGTPGGQCTCEAYEFEACDAGASQPVVVPQS